MSSLIGNIISQLRQEHSLGVEELSERSGISVDKLEKIENGAITPSIGVMIKISRALGMRLGTLLDGHESAGAVVTRAKDTIFAPQDVISGGESDMHRNMNFFSLAKGKKDRAMEPMLIEIDGTRCETQSEHEGEEFLYVLEGVVEIHYGSQVHSLGVGDSIYYDSIVPHTVSSVSGSKAKVLAVIYTPF